MVDQPPANPSYPPSHGGGSAPPPQPGFNVPPQQPGYPPAQQPGYPPSDQSYPPPQAGYPPPQAGYPPPQAGYPPPQAGYPPPQAGYPPPQAGYAPPLQPGYPPPQQGYPSPQVQQPGIAAVPRDPNVPEGLEYLLQIDQLLVHQEVELAEALTGFEMANKYTIKNSLGQKVYFAAEDTDCCTRNCCGPARPFEMKILDNMGREVIHLSRPLRCSSCLFPCCLQKLEVQSPIGEVIGYISQDWSMIFPWFSIQNANEETILKIKGPYCTWAICGDVEFEVLSTDGETQVGKISKQWSGLIKESFTDADNFGITFPMDLDVKMKAVMLGAVFLIDFMFFEQKGNQRNDQPGML